MTSPVIQRAERMAAPVHVPVAIVGAGAGGLTAALMLRDADAIAPSAGLMESRYRRPWSVRATDLPSRLNKGTPSHTSSALIWWLTAPCVTDSSSAAREKLSSLPAASNARIPPSGGNLCNVMLLVLLTDSGSLYRLIL
jgi:hypothetical protein